MSEADLVELAAISRANLSFIVTQIIAVHFAIIAGIYLFLNRAGLLLKISVLVLYSAGYTGLLSLYFLEQTAYQGIREAIQSLPQSGAASAAVTDWAEGSGRFVSTFAKGLFALAWLGITILLFTPILKGRD